MANRRRAYTDEDETRMMEFVVDQFVCGRWGKEFSPCGMAIWREAASRRRLNHHSFYSMQSHWCRELWKSTANEFNRMLQLKKFSGISEQYKDVLRRIRSFDADD